MFGAIVKATNSSFQKGMTICRSIYVKRVMKLLAFIFEPPSYNEWLMIFIPLVYEVYRGYVVFAFSVIMFVCLSVCLSVNFFSVKDFSATT